MSNAFAEATHHETLRIYRRELALEPMPIRRAKLITLIARAKMDADDHGWSSTAE
jgi:hypothetical protein